MKLLGIDFGSKRVGIAVGDTEARVAVPKAVYPNDRYLLGEIKNLLKESEEKVVVMGESQDSSMNDNLIMKEVREFGRLMEIEGIKVLYEPEFMTSEQARRFQGDHALLDASAAAIILQSYIDKLNNQ